MPNIPKGTTLAFDFGEKRIGVANGDSEIGITHPLTTITGEATEPKMQAIGKLISQWQPQQLVVGLPVHTDGTEHDLTRLARKFGRRLHRRFRLPIYWADERLTSLYAESLLNEIGKRGRKQKPMLDQVAAQAILEGFFVGGWVECLLLNEPSEDNGKAI